MSKGFVSYRQILSLHVISIHHPATGIHFVCHGMLFISKMGSCFFAVYESPKTLISAKNCLYCFTQEKKKITYNLDGNLEGE